MEGTSVKIFAIVRNVRTKTEMSGKVSTKVNFQSVRHVVMYACKSKKKKTQMNSEIGYIILSILLHEVWNFQ